VYENLVFKFNHSRLKVVTFSGGLKCIIQVWEQTLEGERKSTAKIRINVLQKQFEFAKESPQNHRGHRD